MGCGASKAPPRDAAPELSAQKKAELADAFSLLDTNGDGKLSQSEIAAAFQKLEIAASEQDLLQLMRRVDADSSGEVDYAEFESMVSWRLHKLGEALVEAAVHAGGTTTGAQAAVPDSAPETGGDE